jgi:WD40 repeat protein
MAPGSHRRGNRRVWDLNTGATLHVLEGSASMIGVAVTPDGKRALTGGWDGTAQSGT